MVDKNTIVKRLAMLGYTATPEDDDAIQFELTKILNYVMNYCNRTDTAPPNPRNPRPNAPTRIPVG